MQLEKLVDGGTDRRGGYDGGTQQACSTEERGDVDARDGNGRAEL